MNLTIHDLKQMDEEWLKKLSHDQLGSVSLKLLSDLKEAHDRLNKTSQNSSRPPSSGLPWEEKEKPTVEKKESEKKHEVKNKPTNENKKKAGKQQGGKGFGRTQKMKTSIIKEHYASCCNACGMMFTKENISKAYTGWNQVDIAEKKSGDEVHGIVLESQRHILYETQCICGHKTKVGHYKSSSVGVGQWRLVGERLAGMIVFLSLRLRLSRARIQELLLEQLGLKLAIGTIDNVIREAGVSAAPLEEELLDEMRKAAKMEVDETPWKEKKTVLWLWVFLTSHTVLYSISHRGKEILETVLEDNFQGIVMSDGYLAYRFLTNRIRCWAHLIRKLQGLADSLDGRAALIGAEMLELFKEVMNAIYQARTTGISSEYLAAQEARLERFRRLCEKYKHDCHAKLGEVAREFLNDWNSIFRQVAEIALPLTNNAAERALRHWVIARRISYGTRCQAGSFTLTMLASIIDTCRLRKASAWQYIASVIKNARLGFRIPALPSIPL